MKIVATVVFGFLLLLSFSNSLDCYPEEPQKVARNLALVLFSTFILIQTWLME